MVRLLARHLTFANVCSALALTVALGTGTAYAANTVRSADIVNGQVRTPDLGGNAVTTAKIGAGQVRTPDLGTGAVEGRVLRDGSVGSSEIQTDGVTGADVAPGAIDSDEVFDNSLTTSDLATNSVSLSELASSSVGGAEVVNDSLTFADLAGGGSSGTVSLPAGAVANGRCEEFGASVSGAEPGDAVVFTVRGDMQDGVFFVGKQVTAATAVRVELCNLSGGVQAAITDLPVRVLTFR